MAKKKKEAITLVQCSVGALQRIKEQAKKEGVFLNRLVTKILNEYCELQKGEIY